MLVLLGGTATRARGPDRALLAAVFAICLCWALHAGVDWDWEVAAVTLPVMALGASALARAEPRAARLPITLRAGIVLATVALAATPAAAAISQARLNDAVRALKKGECGSAIGSAESSLKAMDFRAEPWEVIGYCESRLGRHDPAIHALQRAVDRDPQSWELHYGLSLVEGAAGHDPRAEAATALRLNPRDERAQKAVRLFDTRNPRLWRRAALQAPLPIP